MITITTTILLLVLHQSAFSLLILPRVQLLEHTICHQHYHRNSFSQTLSPSSTLECKTSEIQRELSIVLGLQVALEAVPGIITSGYYGKLADMRGKKRVALMAIVGEIVALGWIMGVCYANFPVKLVWLSSLFLLIGGGHRIFLAMMFSVISSTVREDLRTRFMYVNPGIAAVSSIVAPLVAQRLLLRSVWVPFVVAIILSCICIPVIFALPSSPGQDHITDGDRYIAGSGSPTPEHHYALLRHESSSPSMVSSPISSPDSGKLSRTDFLHTRPLVISYIIFVVKRFAFGSQDFVYQYVSRSFSWPLSRTATLQLAKALGASTILVALPAVSAYALRKKPGTQGHIDLVVLKGVAIVATIGPAMLWFSMAEWELYTSMVIWGLGEGLEPPLQGLCTSFVDPQYTARMFTTIARLELIARVAGSPIMGALVIVSWKGKVIAEGVCFLLSSALFAIVACLTWILPVECGTQMTSNDGDGHESGDDDEVDVQEDESETRE